jgi:hypothetical protein
MVVDRKEGQNLIRVQADRLVVKAGRMVRQAGTESRNKRGSKPGGLEKGE